MKWFGRKAGGGAARPALSRGFSVGAAGEWADGTDAPICEEREAYRVTVTRFDGVARSVTTETPVWTYAAAEVAADMAAGPSVTLSITQQGTLATSSPATFTLTIG